jgi:hypothetical protein
MPVLKGGKTVISDQAIQSVRKNTVALKGGYFRILTPHAITQVIFLFT